MGELRGHSDTPSEQPDRSGRPDQPTDRPRIPERDRGTNRDPETIRRVMRASEHPAFVDPRYEPRSRATSPTNTGIRVDPSKPIFSERPEPPSTPKIKLGEPRRLDELKAETLETETPNESPPIDKDDAGKPDPPGRSSLDKLSGKLAENLDETGGWASSLGTKIDDAVGRVRPTGQHAEHHPDDLGTDGPPAHGGVDDGMAGAAMWPPDC